MAYDYTKNKSVQTILTRALLVGLLAGILAAFLGGMLAGFGATPIGALVTALLLIVVLAAAAKHVKIDEISVFELVLLFAAITFFGSVFGMFVPWATTYILAVGDTLKVSALLFTFLYIAIAELVLSKAGVKV